MLSDKIETIPIKYTIKIKICSRCILDTTVPDIVFDDKGECTYCKIHDKLDKKYPLDNQTNTRLLKIVEKIKKQGKGKKYDCIVGVSGGMDSTNVLYQAVKLGLRPLAVHFDNGWNSELAVSNIKNATDKLGVELYTHVADWEEFKDLQVSFLKASTSDSEVPTDWVIFSVLFDTATKEGVKYILQGHSFRTEGTSPLGWTYMDGRYVKSIHKIFGKKKLTSFPIMTLSKYLYYLFIKRVKQFRINYYLEYDQEKTLKLMEKELGWRRYGKKHFESTYTEFFQSYILPTKFNIDKRKLHYSALVRSGQMDRQEALDKIKNNPYNVKQEKIDYCVKKLGLTMKEFEEIMAKEKRSFKDYPSYYNLIKRMRIPIKIACKLGLIPDVVYGKYFGK